MAYEDLQGKDFKAVKLYKADLRGTNFSSANLTGANLFGAFAKDARFTGANLRLAVLESVDFENAGAWSELVRLQALLSISRQPLSNSKADWPCVLQTCQTLFLKEHRCGQN